MGTSSSERSKSLAGCPVLYVYVYVYTHICMYVCMYVYIYIQIVCIYIHI